MLHLEAQNQLFFYIFDPKSYAYSALCVYHGGGGHNA